MFFCWDITIPADTSEDEPKKEWLTLPNGIITRVDIKFPAGCHGMVKVRLLREESQKVPLNENEWVTGDDETIPTETYIEMADKPYKVKFLGCSPDTTYDHTVTVRIQVALEEQVGIMPLIKLFKKFLSWLGAPFDD